MKCYWSWVTCKRILLDGARGSRDVLMMVAERCCERSNRECHACQGLVEWGGYHGKTLKNRERSLVKGQASIWRSPGELQRTLANSDPISVFFDLLPCSKPEGAGWRGLGEGVVMIGKKETRRTKEWARLFLFSMIGSESGSSWVLEELWSGWKIEVWTVVTVWS